MEELSLVKGQTGCSETSLWTARQGEEDEEEEEEQVGSEGT